MLQPEPLRPGHSARNIQGLGKRDHRRCLCDERACDGLRRASQCRPPVKLSRSEESRPTLLNFSESKHAGKLFRVFDCMCRRKLMTATGGFNDYNQPIIDLGTLDIFVDLAARHLPRLWRHLCALHNAPALHLAPHA